MIGYVTIGTNDFDRAVGFYDGLLGAFGAKRLMEIENFVLWAKPGTMAGGLAVVRPFDQKPATAGNGTMIALAAADRAEVDALHAKALELGASDEGAPGARSDTFYAGYFRDLDGNKLVFYFMG